MSTAPRIAVVTPSFNQGEYIEATLRSVVSQGYEALEYVVVDGGSTDGSVDTIQRYECDLASWVSEPDNGHAHALNKGFAKTTGEIMCWINSSDLHYPWTLRTVAQVFSELPQVEWLMGVPTTLDERGDLKHVMTGASNAYDILAGNYHVIQQESVFWRRSLWERSGGRLNENLERAADFDLWLRFLRLAPLYHAQTILGGFRVHGDALGQEGGREYERESEAVFARFVAEQDRRTLWRARLVRAIGPGRRKIVGETLHRVGIWPWYRHPRVEFDFATGRWTTR